jgi:hypothetical protein
MNAENKHQTTEEIALALVFALIEDDQHCYRDSRLQWVRVVGRLAGMIAGWSKNDICIRQELMAIQELRVKKK